MTNAPTPRALSLVLLAAILQVGATLDEAIAAHPLPANDTDARFTRLLVLSVLRHLGQLDAVIATHLDTPLPAKRIAVQNALRIGVAQLLLLDTPAHAAIHETVALVKQSREGALAGLTNAVLQKISAGRPKLPSPGHNLPAWWGTRLDMYYGPGTARAIAAVAATRPPLDLNLPSPASMTEGERIDDIIWRFGPDHSPVQMLPGYDDGAFFVQDIAASYPARLLGDVRGQRVLDLCAAPGGKSMQLARAGASVTALDRSEHRLQRLRDNMTRLQLDVEIIAADALAWEPSAIFDAILLDAPCSATGTWRRHPEVVRLASPEKIAALAALQQQLLNRAWHWLKPGGRMVYCTCSLEPEEGEQQIAAFLNVHPDAKHVPLREGEGIPAEAVRNGMLRTLPSMLAEHGGMDGFFAAVLEKTA